MIGRPERGEYADYYHGYVSRISDDDVFKVLTTQSNEIPALLNTISEEKSLHRYAADKWSIRELLNHINDTERVFLFRALWFGRGYTDPLPSFEQEVAAATAHANDFPWANHVNEFRNVRASTLSFFQSLPEEAWHRSGVASGNSITVRALAYILAGHADHHASILRERYLT